MSDDASAPSLLPAVPDELAATVRDLDLPDQFLRELAEYPHLSEDILLEVLESLGHLDPENRPERERRLLEALRAHPVCPEAGQYASVQLVRRLGASAEPAARAEAERILAELLDGGGLGEGPALPLAEHLEGAGEGERALHCYDLASRSLLATPPERIAELDFSALAPLMGRAGVRRDLGLDQDGHDRAVLEAGRRHLRKNPYLAWDEGFLDLDGLDLGAERETPSIRPGPAEEIRVAFSRESFERARSRGMLGPRAADREPGAYYRDAERALREEAREHPGAALYTALAEADAIAEFAARQGTDPAGEGLLRAWAQAGGTPGGLRPRPWPPEHDHLCWCGADLEYGECCGVPDQD